jgi:histidyl-tRNA synthetase
MPPISPNSSYTYARPPGFYDRTAAESAHTSALIAALTQAMARFGYQAVETPLVEYADLFLAKSGDEWINRLITFDLYGRQLCLRSEFTPSAARLYVERHQHEPKPLRWQFAGPVFRYESAGRTHSRQFTMLGTEFIGAAGAAADAETMGLAAHGLSAIGARGWTLNVGHVGLVSALLNTFDLDRRMRRFLLGHVENLRRSERGRAYVEAQLAQLMAGESAPASAATEESDHHEGDGGAIERLIKSARLGATGATRTMDDIARRLQRKSQRAAHQGEIMRALDFLEALAAIEGPTADGLARLERLARDLPDPQAQAILRSFRASLDLLAAYGVETGQVRLQMGLARGLNYYTGLVFEIYSDHAEVGQLCGGGRYDELIGLMGAGVETPAIGFVYGVERLLLHLRTSDPQSEAAADGGPRAHVLVVPAEEGDEAEAVRTATRLRVALNVELYTPPARNLSQALTRADKHGTPFVVIVSGAAQVGDLTVRDMAAGVQFACTADELIRRVREREVR